MVNQVYRLTSPKQIRIDFVDEHISKGDVVVRPLYLSICAADQRYYTGSRDPEVLKEKLPMALIHEGVGEVIYDPKNEFKPGENVVMIPNTPTEQSKTIKDNYLRSSRFRASGFDGFMQSFVVMDRKLIISFNKIDLKTSVLLELVSVTMNGIDHFESNSHSKKGVIGVWGSGNVGFITALILKNLYPDSKIIVFGTNQLKLNYFTFVDEIYNPNNIPENIRVDHAFECVGGNKSEDAINNIIDIINPMGSIVLMGVSEHNVNLNTRMILEKGLTILGSSRSNYSDFKKSVELLENNVDVQNYLNTIISEEVIVKKIEDIHKAFENDLSNPFKTVMKWEI